MKSKSANINYRPEIDGLRAIAILSVVLFHLSPKYVPGGFIGVDIFFVISGYLITQIINKSLEQDNFSIIHFWQRRIARLYPALLLMLISMFILGSFVMTAKEFKSLSLYSMAGLTYWTNFLLYSEIGYFDIHANLKPYLHLWSLAIEEQFYLFYPLILMIAKKMNFSVRKILTAIILFSFFFFIYYSKNNSAFAFYIPLNRFWELGAGGYLALTDKIFEIKNVYFQKLKSIVSFAFIGVICFSSHSYDVANPVFYIVAVIAAYLILIPSDFDLGHKVLKTKALVYVGLISYPLYLWHWPLFSYLRIIENNNPGRMLLLAALALAVILAIFTYEGLEKRCQSFYNLSRINLNKSVVGIVSISVMVLIISGLIFKSEGVPARLAQKYQESAIQLSWVDVAKYCSNERTRPQIAIIGDSHAEHYAYGIMQEICPKNIDIVFYYHQGCLPMFTLGSGKDLNACEIKVNTAIHEVSEDPNIKWVILAGRYSNHLKAEKDKQKFREKLEATNRKIKDKKILFLSEAPAIGREPAECIQVRPFSFSRTKECQFQRTDQRIAEHHFLQRSLLELNNPSVLLFDGSDLMCNSENQCQSQIGKYGILFRDDNHLSIRGSLMMASEIAPIVLKDFSTQ